MNPSPQTIAALVWTIQHQRETIEMSKLLLNNLSAFSNLPAHDPGRPTTDEINEQWRAYIERLEADP